MLENLTCTNITLTMYICIYNFQKKNPGNFSQLLSKVESTAVVFAHLFLVHCFHF